MQVSLSLITVSGLLIAACLYLTWVLRQNYVRSLTSVEEKSAGIIFFYRNAIRGLFEGQPQRLSVLAALHYATLHLIPLFTGLSFYLKTDANFLIVIGSIVWSMQLFQRLFPGEDSTEEEP